IPELEGEFCDREGLCLPFAKTQAERLAKGDPRLSLEERYGSHAAYVQRVSEVVRELLQARLLLPEDAARFVDAAARQEAIKGEGEKTLGRGGASRAAHTGQFGQDGSMQMAIRSHYLMSEAVKGRTVIGGERPTGALHQQ